MPYDTKPCPYRRLVGIEKRVPSAVPGLLAEGLLARMLRELRELCDQTLLLYTKPVGSEKRVPSAVLGLLAEGLLARMLRELRELCDQTLFL